MFKYGKRRYRFISHEPLQVGDTVNLINRNGDWEITDVIETRPDIGKWVLPDHLVKAGKTVLTNLIIVNDGEDEEDMAGAVQVHAKGADPAVANNDKRG